MTADPATVALPRETVLEVIDFLRLGLTKAGHRAQITPNESRGHCPSSGVCVASCRAYADLLHELMDALGVPKTVGSHRRTKARREARTTTDRPLVQPSLLEEAL